jgi:hypothetical protein
MVGARRRHLLFCINYEIIADQQHVKESCKEVGVNLTTAERQNGVTIVNGSDATPTEGCHVGAAGSIE